MTHSSFGHMLHCSALEDQYFRKEREEGRHSKEWHPATHCHTIGCNEYCLFGKKYCAKHLVIGSPTNATFL